MKMLLSAAVVALSCMAFAEGPEGPKAPPSAAMGDPLVRIVSNPKTAEKIGLSAEQAATIKGIMKEQRKTDKEFREKMKVAMQKEMSLLNAEKVDEPALMAAIDELFDIRKEMAKSQTRKVLRVKAVLTPEQIEKALEEMENQRQERKARRGARSGRRPPEMGGRPPEGGNPPPKPEGENPPPDED